VGTTTYTPGIPIIRREKNVSMTVIMYHAADPEAASAIDAEMTLKRLTS